MAREQGTFPLSANFEVKKKGTLDARQMVDNFADLLAFTAANFVDKSFFVAVRGVANASEFGLYQCKNPNALDQAASWVKVGAETKIKITIPSGAATKDLEFTYKPFPLNTTGTLQKGDIAKDNWVSDTKYGKTLIYKGTNGIALDATTNISDWNINEYIGN